MITIEQLKDIKTRTEALYRYLDIENKKIQVEEEQLRTQAPGFWDDAKAAEEQMKKVKGLQKWIDGYKEVKTLCDEMNIRIFVDADADVRLCRRIRRDVKNRGRSIDSVIDQYLTTVKPMHELYVEPSKKNANLIVPEGGKNLIALEMIINRIQRHIDGNAE